MAYRPFDHNQTASKFPRWADTRPDAIPHPPPTTKLNPHHAANRAHEMLQLWHRAKKENFFGPPASERAEYLRIILLNNEIENLVAERRELFALQVPGRATRMQNLYLQNHEKRVALCAILLNKYGQPLFHP